MRSGLDAPRWNQSWRPIILHPGQDHPVNHPERRPLARVSASPGHAKKTVPDLRIFGVNLCALNSTALVNEITQSPACDGVRLVVTMNLDHVVRLRQDEAFRRAYDRAWAVTVDGAPIFAYARARGAVVPERVTGADLVVELTAKLPQCRRVFFVVSNLETGARLVDLFYKRGFQKGALAYSSPAFGFENNEVQSAALVEQIRGHGTTDLVFGLGAPKSEVWVDRHREQLGNLYAFGFGAGLDFLAGVTPRAPLLMRKVGLEWLWRLALNPERLWRRYLVDSWNIFPAILQDLAGRAPHGGHRLKD